MSGWNNEQHIVMLKTLWISGHSASEVAAALAVAFRDARYTRNAIVGKAHRLGLFKDNRQRAEAAPPSRLASTPSVPRHTKIANGHNLKADPVTPRLPREPLPTSRDLAPTCDLLGLGAHMCRWPIGDPASPSFGFCGRVTDGTYCTTPSRPDGASHRDRAYQPASATEKDFARGLRRYLG